MVTTVAHDPSAEDHGMQRVQHAAQPIAGSGPGRPAAVGAAALIYFRSLVQVAKQSMHFRACCRDKELSAQTAATAGQTEGHDVLVWVGHR
jgi:hypothetical protein